ncbi:hypothetical protein IWX63_002343 [Arthrobacter sp. CAN_A2]
MIFRALAAKATSRTLSSPAPQAAWWAPIMAGDPFGRRSAFPLMCAASAGRLPTTVAVVEAPVILP